jgi:hypothetical protein
MKTIILPIIITCSLCAPLSLMVLAENPVKSNDESLAKDLYAIGYYYYTKQQYEQADIVLRYMLLHVLKVKNPCVSEWHYAAQTLLMSDLMYAFYPGKTYWKKYQWIIDGMSDEDLFDIESVMRKHGKYMNESEKNNLISNNMGSKETTIRIDDKHSIYTRYFNRRTRALFFKGETGGKGFSQQIIEDSDRSTGSVKVVSIGVL